MTLKAMKINAGADKQSANGAHIVVKLGRGHIRLEPRRPYQTILATATPSGWLCEPETVCHGCRKDETDLVAV